MVGNNLKIWGANVSSLQYLLYTKTIFLEPTMVTWCVLALSADTQVDQCHSDNRSHLDNAIQTLPDFFCDPKITAFFRIKLLVFEFF